MKLNKGLKRALAFMLVLSFLILVLPVEIHQAASSYDDAKQFYESTGQIDDKHIDVYDGKVYFATQAKLASSSSNTRYTTLGFDVTLSGGERSVSFVVKRGGSLAQVGNPVKSGNYEYILYEISTEDLFRLAQAIGNASASTVLSAAKIDVRMDAIMTTKVGSSVKGGITENGYGGFTSWGTIYRVKDSSDLNKMMDIFSGHKFKSYTEITDRLDNYQLSILYDAGDGASVGNGYTEKAYNAGGTTVSNAIHASGSVVQDKHRVVSQFYLKSPSHFGLSKTGYYIPSGKEWVKADGSVYTSSKVYMPKNIEPTVGFGDKGVILYANWKANPYTVEYNANGGHGWVATQSVTYGQKFKLGTSTFQKTGYYLPKGKEWKDSSGKTYANGQEVQNLTTAYNGKVTLYANWQPVVVRIDLDKQGGTNGTDNFWEKFGVGFYPTDSCNGSISKITPPERTGYKFVGYFLGSNGLGKEVTNSAGTILRENSYFYDHSKAYANWSPEQYEITFDMQGGENGSIFAIATYDAVYPMVNIRTSESLIAPEWDGYRFVGYYTEKEGKGTQVYNEYMVADAIYKETTNQTLYADWVDDIPPILIFTGKDTWTNLNANVTADASDLGSGLYSIQIYQINMDETETLVAEIKDLDGEKQRTLSFKNLTEGVIRYRAVATDVAGNSVESYATVLYDITAPTGEIITSTINGTKFYFGIDITDINTGD